jgi:uncharacterized protein YecE (DUF72 family)
MSEALHLPFPARPPQPITGGALPGLRIGTSGFSYPDWRGPFYPERLPDRQMLDYYAERFRAVEINATYYQIPAARTMASLATRAGGRLEFAVKAHQDMTHARANFPSAAPAFRDAVAPLRDAGSLACILVQFPPSFRASAEGRDFLRRVAGELAPDPVAIEIRHASWATEETFDLLRQLGLAYCCVDAPPLPGLPPPLAPATAPLAYVRFHGRNAAAWRKPTGGRHARYDYLYTEAELREWLPRLRDLAGRSERCYAFFNNHVRGQAITNAHMLAALLAG